MPGLGKCRTWNGRISPGSKACSSSWFFLLISCSNFGTSIPNFRDLILFFKLPRFAASIDSKPLELLPLQLLRSQQQHLVAVQRWAAASATSAAPWKSAGQGGGSHVVLGATMCHQVNSQRPCSAGVVSHAHVQEHARHLSQGRLLPCALPLRQLSGRNSGHPNKIVTRETYYYTTEVQLGWPNFKHWNPTHL